MSILDIAVLAHARAPRGSRPRDDLVIAPWLHPTTHVYGMRASLTW